VSKIVDEYCKHLQRANPLTLMSQGFYYKKKYRSLRNNICVWGSFTPI